MHFSARSSRRGSTLIVALFVVSLLSVFIGLALSYTQQTALNARRGRDYTVAHALADGALEAVFAKWQYLMATNQNSNYGTSDGDFGSHKWLQTNICTPVLASLKSASTNSEFVITELDITPVDQADNPQDTQLNAYASTGPLPDTPGWVARSDNFRARAVVVKTGLAANAPTNADTSGKLVVSVSRYFQKADASLFQAMLFFNDDLELHPGAQMTLYGLVHTNKNMYAVAQAGSSLTFTSNVSYAGSPPPDPAAKRPANFYMSKDKGYIEGVTQTLYDQEGQWTSFANPTYGSGRDGNQLSQVQTLDPLGLGKIKYDAKNPNDTGTHEIIERPVTTSSFTSSTITASSAYTDPVASRRLYNSANLRILINRNATSNGGVPVRVFKPGSNPADSVYITANASGTAEQKVAAQIVAAISPEGTTASITDAREGRKINLDDVDVSKLITPLNSYASYNGVVYISDVTNVGSDGQMGNSDGIKLIRGGTLPTGSAAAGTPGFTVVTDGAVYVQGDYNTNGTYATSTATVTTTQPDSNSLTNPLPDNYTVDGKAPVPAAVIGDAVMVLSNAWLDANSTGTRVATPTTFNAALVSGQVLTNSTTDKSSGGAHNFPRFLENWSDKNFTYHGSMVELYPSQHFTGTYSSAGSIYSPPKRRWYFENRFVMNPPPGNLRATDYVRGRWVRNTLTGYEPLP